MAGFVSFEMLQTHVALVTLNRPQAANAMSRALLDELNETIEQINTNKEIYCTIITGAGDKVFCAGADLKERKGMDNAQVVEAVRYIGHTVNQIENMTMPVIAAINGAAYGGGLELALACDIRIAANEVKMGLTETTLAIIPGAGGTQRLSRLIGRGHAKRLIFSGSPVYAEEAVQLGIVEQLYDNTELMDQVFSLAETIAANGPIALRQAKQAINRGLEVDLSTGLEIEHLCYKETIPTKDRMEGLRAFKEKRKPNYTGN
ncbi:MULTISPECIES: enoyl-CoA hydratase [unclassified Virgibacillus]|uniref:enoyl-CoA hydratase n=1 Tax=unclassified Virgibacillus TaxID=2620237 RepID=UPI0024DEE22A|nr:enoyl-CoA hydratase [Virgibacillus sp. LDC-1]